ncbi:MAG: energy-coupling factor transporter transmembrane component T, partial [Stackebrandtia sp.]
AVVNAVFAADKGGAALVEFGPLLLTEANAQAGLALGLRVAAVAVPGVLAFATTDPTELADSLTQQLKAPPKFAIGALAAFRLLPLLAAEWRMIVLARRARGVEAGWNPIARVRLFASAMFVLLVGAIRRGGRLAVAMDARGFDAETPRGVARPQQVRLSDWLVLAGVAATCAAAIAVSATLGIFRAVF